MKKLYLIRHAKSSWKDESLSDFERPLNKRGKLNAPLMGSVLKKKKVHPDIILSSKALRAKTTAKIIAKELKCTHEIEFRDEIYEANTYSLYRLLTKVSDNNNLVFLIGHNPSLNDLAKRFVDFEENIPTCGIVEIEFTCQYWNEIDASNAKLISFDYPKNYDIKE